MWMTNWNAAWTFIANVVAWPASTTPGAGYVNLHYSMVDQKKPGNLVKGLGWPYQSINEFIKRARWIADGHQTMKDVWFCTSRQSQMKLNKGKPKAVRFASNAMAQKSIWIDLDVGPSEPGKKPKYARVEDALKAVLLFAKTVGLPQPSAIVFSGSGVHVYWISKTELTPAEWQPFARGLKNLLLANHVASGSDFSVTVTETQGAQTEGSKNAQATDTVTVTENSELEPQELTAEGGTVEAASSVPQQTLEPVKLRRDRTQGEDEALRGFSAAVLDLDRRTAKRPPACFSTTAAPLEVLARLGKLLTDVANLKKSDAIEATPAVVLRGTVSDEQPAGDMKGNVAPATRTPLTSDDGEMP
jgi:hypothetical protein